MNYEELISRYPDKRNRLDSLLAEGYADIQFENQRNAYVIERTLPYVKGPRVCSLGYAGDEWPNELAKCGHQVSIIEGSKTHFELAKERLSGTTIKVYQSLFETFVPEHAFDTVIAGSVIEFFENPTELINACIRMLHKEGRLIFTTPNALSIHRRIGALIGLEGSPFEINAKAKASMCYHLFTLQALRSVLRDAGLSNIHIFGAGLKILSNAQMAELSPDVLGAFDLLSSEVPPELCKTLVAVADV